MILTAGKAQVGHVAWGKKEGRMPGWQNGDWQSCIEGWMWGRPHRTMMESSPLGGSWAGRLGRRRILGGSTFSRTDTYFGVMNQHVRKVEFMAFVENEAKIHVDSYIEGAVHLAEEVHAGVRREDGTSPFLETHIFPVAMDVIRHYKWANKPMTTIQIVSAILHDVMEDNDRILDLHAAKSYGFEAYFSHRFGEYVYRVATTLKTKPLDIYPGADSREQELERFRDYCNTLARSDYDIKTIKLADRLNNMRFISGVPGHEKIERYVREAEDFYMAYSIIEPRMDDYYGELRKAYEDLKRVARENSRITA